MDSKVRSCAIFHQAVSGMQVRRKTRLLSTVTAFEKKMRGERLHSGMQWPSVYLVNHHSVSIIIYLVIVVPEILSRVGNSRSSLFETGEEMIRLWSAIGRYGVNMSSLRVEKEGRFAKVKRRYTPVFYSCCIQQVRMRACEVEL